MSKWVRFTRTFNYVPKNKSAVTIQHPAGAIDDVTDAHAERAIAAGAAVEIQAPANADQAKALRSGELKPVDVVEKPAAAPAPAPAPAGKPKAD